MHVRETMMAKRTSWMIAFAVAVAGLAGVVVPSAMTGDAVAAGGCEASVGSVWLPARQRPHRAEAFSNGPNCQKAIVVITVRGPDGSAQWVDAMKASDLMTFADVKTTSAMKVALNEWIAQGGPFKTAADLPPWPPGAEHPVNGEFPFYPEQGVDRDYYEKARALRAPLFCYVQGMESMSCVALIEGGMVKLGVQSFPG